MFLITAVGRDRPGMTHAVAQTLFEAGCNIEDTTMTRLSGEFAMMLIVTPPAQITLESLSNRLSPLETSHGLFINTRDIGEAPQSTADAQSRWIVTVYGPEKAGLLAQISGVLATHGANLTDVQSRVASGGGVYIMIFEIETSGSSADDLLSSLQTAASEIGVSVSLRALEEDVI